MAFDKSLPSNTTKIREYPEVLNGNFGAIEDGDEAVGTKINLKAVLLGNRNDIAGIVDPTPVGATTYIYSREDADAVQEAYIENAAANVIQVTQGTHLGSSVTDVGFNSLSNDKGVTSYDEKNFVAYWATIDATGAIQGQSPGITCAQIGADASYTITFTVAQSSANYAVNVTALRTAPAGNPRIGQYNTVTNNNFRVDIVNQTNTIITGGAPFSVSIFGGRPA